ncbi:glutathione S-transferase Mu 2 isoform X2 [Parasteatoda tepidariorum]
MLAYKEEKFEDKRYDYGPAPNYRQEWLKVKNTLGLAFPNLPYYIDGDVKLSQSIAILRYLARKLKLDAETEEERIRTDLIEQQAIDLRAGLVSIAYNEDFAKLKVDYLKNLPLSLQQFADFLGKKSWFAGDRLTYVDFLVYEVLDQHLVLDPDCLKQFPSLEGFLKEFKGLPTIEKYMNSPDFLSFPLNGDMAYFGSRRGQK